MNNLLNYLIPVLLIMYGCASSKVDSGSSDAGNSEEYKSIASEKYPGESVRYINSPEGRYVLCVNEKKATAQNPRNNVKYFVFDLKSNKVAYEENLGAGYVKWFSETQIERFRTPGIIQKDQTNDDIATLYNLETGKSVTKKQFLDSKPK